MKIGRHKNLDWEKVYCSRLDSARKLFRFPGRIPPAIAELNAQLILEAVHHGPWRAIWALLTHELHDVWQWHCGDHWEWIRVKLLRRKPNPDLLEAQRTIDEWKALDEIARDL